MAKLKINDPVGLGEFLIKAARFDAEKAQLLGDPNGQIGRFATVPARHTIVVHEDTADVTHVILPWKNDVERSLEKMRGANGYSYPREFDPNSPNFIDPAVMTADPKVDPPKAYKFRVGDYLLTRCGDPD